MRMVGGDNNVPGLFKDKPSDLVTSGGEMGGQKGSDGLR